MYLYEKVKNQFTGLRSVTRLSGLLTLKKAVQYFSITIIYIFLTTR